MSSFSKFIDIINSTSNRDLLEDFMISITTDKERSEITQRLEIAKRLIDGQPQAKIARELGVGIATVTRGSKEIAKGRFRILR